MSKPSISSAAPRLTAQAALTFSLGDQSTSGEIQLLPAGPTFRAADGSGRPAEVPVWRIDAAIAARLIQKAAAKANRVAIDYEHQTLLAEKNGQPAPAAGWFAGAGLVWRDGKGLFATGVEWTPRAKDFIANSEYLYVSPVFDFDKQTGEVLDVQLAALTNNPGLDGMARAALLAHFDAALTSPNDFLKEQSMNETLKKLLAALGLPETTTEADALSAVSKLQTSAEKANTAENKVAALTAQLQAGTNAPDPAKFVPVEIVSQLQSQLAVLSANFNQSEASKVVDEAIAAGRMNPALKDWANLLGKSDLAALKAFVAASPAVAALTGTQTGGNAPATGTAGTASFVPSSDDLAVMKAMGMSAEEFAKGKE